MLWCGGYKDNKVCFICWNGGEKYVNISCEHQTRCVCMIAKYCPTIKYV